MSSSDFRQISSQSSYDRAERLFRASISAYCCLAHPTRAETTQLEDLTMPLYEKVSDDGLRFAAAALSECAAPPQQLVRRLAQQRVEISAPLIVRSNVLTDGDLISMIARRGMAHARVIARRKSLNPAIAALIRQMEMNESADTKAASVRQMEKASVAKVEIEHKIAQADIPAPIIPAEKSEAVRAELRGMMAPSRATTSGVTPIHVYSRLRAASMSGDRNQLIAVLSQSLDIDVETAKGLLGPGTTDLLVSALRALALTGEQALLVIACAVPSYFARPDAGREILNAFTRQDIASARKSVEQFTRDDSVSVSFAREISRAALARTA